MIQRFVDVVGTDVVNTLSDCVPTGDYVEPAVKPDHVVIVNTADKKVLEIPTGICCHLTAIVLYEILFSRLN